MSGGNNPGNGEDPWGPPTGDDKKPLKPAEPDAIPDPHEYGEDPEDHSNDPEDTPKPPAPEPDKPNPSP